MLLSEELWTGIFVKTINSSMMTPCTSYLKYLKFSFNNHNHDIMLLLISGFTGNFQEVC